MQAPSRCRSRATRSNKISRSAVLPAPAGRGASPTAPQAATVLRVEWAALRATPLAGPVPLAVWPVTPMAAECLTTAEEHL